MAATHNCSLRGLVVSGLKSTYLHSPGVPVVGVVLFIILLLRVSDAEDRVLNIYLPSPRLHPKPADHELSG